MRQRRSGHLVVLSSLASYRGLPLMGGYCASKAGVSALFESLRVELEPLGLHVTIICPGWIRTPLTTSIDVPQPYMMEVEFAVAQMVEAIRRKRRRLVFPPRAAWQVRVLRWLPPGVSDWLVRDRSRNLVLALRDTYRCVVPDHIGCGLSDKPPESLYDYSLKSRVDDLEALLDHLGLRENLTLVLHDWGGMIGMAFAARRPDRTSTQ